MTEQAEKKAAPKPIPAKKLHIICGVVEKGVKEVFFFLSAYIQVY